LLGYRPVIEHGLEIELRLAECRAALSRLGPAIPLGLSDAVGSLLAAERSDRPATADTAARLFSSFTDEQRAIDELRQNLADVCARELCY
jgi:hypothetical protein